MISSAWAATPPITASQWQYSPSQSRFGILHAGAASCSVLRVGGYALIVIARIVGWFIASVHSVWPKVAELSGQAFSYLIQTNFVTMIFGDQLRCQEKRQWFRRWHSPRMRQNDLSMVYRAIKQVLLVQVAEVLV
jgi:hypothetical protein